MDPETLVLHRLTPALAAARAPGPGAIRKVEWKPIAEKLLQNKKAFQTDAAKSYRAPWRLARQCGALQEGIKVKGKWRWQLPKYVRIATHKVPGTKTALKVKAGTQVIERAWRYLKDRVVLNQNCTTGSKRLRSKLRSAQYLYWYRQKDLWVATGELCTWEMRNFLRTA